MSASTFVPNFSVFDPPSPTYSSTVSDSFSSMSPSTPSHSSPIANNDYSVFNASYGDFNFDSLRQGQDLNSHSSGDWSSEGKGFPLSSHGQRQSHQKQHQQQLQQQYHYLPQGLQQQQYVNQLNQQQSGANVFPNQQLSHHQFQPFQTGLPAQQGEQGQQPQLTLAQSAKTSSPPSTKVSKKGATQRRVRRGDDGAQKRAIHNATERARRETLNGRFLDLAAVIPATSTVRRPSKPLIVKSALSFVEEALKVETLYRNQINGLSAENERLITLLNAEREKLGLEQVTLKAKKDFIMPTPLSEMKATDVTGSQEDEAENENDSENGYGLGGGSQDDFQSSTQSNDNESDSGLSSHQPQFNDFSGFSMHPTFLHHPGQPMTQMESASGPFTAPVIDPIDSSNPEVSNGNGVFFPDNFNDGRRHSVSGFAAPYPQNY